MTSLTPLNRKTEEAGAGLLRWGFDTETVTELKRVQGEEQNNHDVTDLILQPTCPEGQFSHPKRQIGILD